jgi:hypothetical protein
MYFTVNWTAHIPGSTTVIKHSDVNNYNMYLSDDIGNRYNHVGASGAAAEHFVMQSDMPVIGGFVFTLPDPGARSFTFHYDGNDLDIFLENNRRGSGGNSNITDIVLINPVIVSEELSLKWYPLALEYKVASWNPGLTETGGSMLTHNTLTDCKLLEWEPSAVQGTYKNTMIYGSITYEIYGWRETNWNVREYLAIDGIQGLDPNVKPLFHMIIPFDNSQQCIADAGEVLTSLHQIAP